MVRKYWLCDFTGCRRPVSKGIVQSGATETMGVSFNTQESSTRLAENVLENLGITEENLEDIQTVS